MKQGTQTFSRNRQSRPTEKSTKTVLGSQQTQGEQGWANEETSRSRAPCHSLPPKDRPRSFPRCLSRSVSPWDGSGFSGRHHIQTVGPRELAARTPRCQLSLSCSFVKPFGSGWVLSWAASVRVPHRHRQTQRAAAALNTLSLPLLHVPCQCLPVNSSLGWLPVSSVLYHVCPGSRSASVSVPCSVSDLFLTLCLSNPLFPQWKSFSPHSSFKCITPCGGCEITE